MPSKAIKPTTLRLHPDLLRRADRLAGLNHTTRSQMVIRAVAEGLKRLEKQQMAPEPAKPVNAFA